ncbi:YjeF N-terminal domain-containing protein [Syncephalastrum racemosum]|uniref:Enhancer of mRNA-decapping protein 3 n=1 Tax=Syncephalastrum racemosum TaxID=13706 RepID=A0A1X2HKP6_SYNRA|nr:YjeF N-terminal domain-containing protein [Syncephalastrum racemosum]
MAEAFIGMAIIVQLKSGLQASGVVSEVDPATQLLTLENVDLGFPGQSSTYFTPLFGVMGADVDDLQVKPTRRSGKPTPSRSTEREKNARKQQLQQQKKSTSSSTRRSKQPQQSQSYQDRGWAGEDVDGFREKEFDFQANLDMFDKKKIFDQIRETDEKASEDLLVTLNRLPQEKRVNLLPTENVLDGESEQQKSADDADEEKSDSIGEESDTTESDKDSFVLRTASHQVTCPRISPVEMHHVEQHYVQSTGLTQDMMYENGGRAACQTALHVAPSPALVVVLAGNTKAGAYGLACARHLLNHGVRVVVCIGYDVVRGNIIDSVLLLASMVKKSGGKIINAPSELRQYQPDLIIDAMLGADIKLNDLSEEDEMDALCKMIRWASNTKARILSLDFPTGCDAEQGFIPDERHAVRPEWTLCMGMPKTGCVSEEVTGLLYLADLGIPPACWKNTDCKPPPVWGPTFFESLEYTTR